MDTQTPGSQGGIKTRILIISDTHGIKPKPVDAEAAQRYEEAPDYVHVLHEKATGYRCPLPTADVALHCGDLTRASYTEEFEATFSMIRAIPAPLKLVIAGNHDLMLDDEYWDDRYSDKRRNRSRMWRLIKEAETDGVKYLTEGTYDFDLGNGARLTVYASPYTPAYGGWAFQYTEGHDYKIPRQVDIAMTHGPPKNILDWCKNGASAGCPQLLEAVREARPRIHCYGHIHESWGAILSEWALGSKVGDEADTCLNENASRLVMVKKKIERGSPETFLDAKREPVSDEKMAELTRQRGVMVDVTQGELKSEVGKNTLFVNAAIMDWRYFPSQLPWIVDIDLAPTPT